jgi:hypothetical protein
MTCSRRSVRNRDRSSGQKYSSETSAFEVVIPGANAQVDLSFVSVPASTTCGDRKAESFTRNMNAIGQLGVGAPTAGHLDGTEITIRTMIEDDEAQGPGQGRVSEEITITFDCNLDKW